MDPSPRPPHPGTGDPGRAGAGRRSRRDHRTPQSLVELARTVVARADSARLRVVGTPETPYGGGGGDEVALVQRSGSPTFLCGPESRLSAVVGAEARLTIRDRRAHPATVNVVLTGRLVVASPIGRPPTGPDVVALAVTAVIVEYDDPSSPTVVQRALAVDDYLGGRLDPPVATGGTLERHLTECHQRELRAYAAVVADCAHDDVAGASVTELEADRVRLTWVDRDGGGCVELRLTALLRFVHD